jgi:uncharacterized membrane protein YbhN (UPF0104 family)
MRSAIRHSLIISALGMLLYGIALIATGRMQLGRGLALVTEPQYALVLGLSLANYGLRYLRWQFYLGTLGYRIAGSAALPAYLGGFCFTVSPGKIGEGIRLFLFQDLGVPCSTTAALMVLERVVDTACLAILACLLMFALPSYRWITLLSWLLAGAGLYLIARPGRLEQLLRANERWLPVAVLRVGRATTRSLATIAPLLRWRMLLFGLAAGLIAWLAEGIGFALLGQWMMGNVGMAYGIGGYAIATLAGALSMLPGGLGSTEATMTALLLLAGAHRETALLATLLCRAATLWFAVLIGAAALLMIWKRGRLRLGPVQP